MIRVSIAAVTPLLVMMGLEPSLAQQPRPVVATPGVVAVPNSDVAAERPMSIFNDRVRRFRFELEETLVTAETVEGFMRHHQARNQPEIIGAYADSATNSLVVVGPPEAEEAIRITLAKWIVDRQGVSPPPLTVQQRTLQFRRKELLREMAQLEVQMVGQEGQKAEQLQARLQSMEAELSVVEEQIQVVGRYLRRLDETDSGRDSVTVAR
jgi:hypothetical protein